MTRTAPRDGADLHVVVAGGGVAALEAILALRHLAEEHVDIDVVAPEDQFWYRPLSVVEPFESSVAPHFDLADLAARAGAFFTLGELVAVDAPAHRATLRGGLGLEYGALLLALGARPEEAVPGALTFRGPADSEAFKRILAEVEAGTVSRLVFVVPAGVVWPLPLYELALMTRNRVPDAELAIVTHEETPLVIFGREGSEAVAALLDERGIELHTSVYALEAEADGLRIRPDGVVPADRVVALPRLAGREIEGIPHDSRGFVSTDRYGHVYGVEDVYAAGDLTTFPVKQGGIATQQADAVAWELAAQAGAPVTPQPFEPVLRGLLLTGTSPTYLRAELGPGRMYRSEAASVALWWPPAKVVGRYLAPFLASLANLDLEEPPEGPGVLRVEATLPVDAP